MADLINKTDSFNTGRGKLNTAIQDSETALNTANTALSNSESTQDQLDQVVIDGDSSVEAAQARVDADGVTHQTLKERLDYEHNSIIDKNPIYLTDYGVTHTKTAADNTPIFKQAIADAELENRPIILPWTPSNSWIDIDDKLDITNPIKIYGYGKQSKIRQTVFPNQIFNVLSPDVTIENFSANGVDFDATGMGDSHVTYAGVYIQSSDVIVNNIFGDNISTVVNVVGDSVTPIERIAVTNIESTQNVVFNLLFSGVKGIYFNNIKGSYKFMTGVSTPPHLVYASQAYGNSYDILGSNLHAINGSGSFAFQFKGIKGGELSNLFASNSQGVFHVTESNDLKTINILSVDDQWTGKQQASLDIEGTNDNISIQNVNIKMATDGKGVRLSSQTSNSNIKDIKLETNHTTANTNDDAHDIDIRGTNNVVKNAESRNIGSAEWVSSIGMWGGTNNRIVEPETSGNVDGIYVRSGNSGSVIQSYSMSDFENFSRRPITAESPIELRPIEGFGEKGRVLHHDRADAISGSTGIIKYTSSGGSWVVPYGEFKITNNRIYNSVGTGAIAYLEFNTSNIDLKFGLKYANRETAVIRAIDRDNYIGARLDDTLNLAYIFKRESGTNTRLAEVAFTPQVGRRYEYRVIAYNDVIDFYVDGVKITSTTLSSGDMTTFGNILNHGISGNLEPEGLFDNIEWRSVE